jgi:hypothetical protein
LTQSKSPPPVISRGPWQPPRASRGGQAAPAKGRPTWHCTSAN